ncbi:MAG: transporter associated domain-containing protein, partial [Candidatus Sedimenticola sp. (ex Thyasira tokunagai)]
DIVGILHARDLLEFDLENLDEERGKFLKLLRHPYFVPESKPALELFNTFKERKRSFALTVDEYGGVTGLITMEDLLECIFGDIPSPSDINEQFEVEQLDDKRYRIEGSMPLDDFDSRFGTLFNKREVETIGGLVLNEFGELPAEGEVIVIDEFKLTISKVAQNRIVDLLLEQIPEGDEVKEGGRDSLKASATPEVES